MTTQSEIDKKINQMIEGIQDMAEISGSSIIEVFESYIENSVFNTPASRAIIKNRLKI